MGQQSDPEIRKEMGVVNDPRLQQYVEGIAQRLASGTERPGLPWTFTVVDSPSVNAFALPGGYIYLTRGILAHLNSEAELAGVLGHEIAHVTARHSAAQYSKQTAGSLGLLLGQIFVPELQPFGQVAEAGLGVLFLKFGRDDELQADNLGAGLRHRGGLGSPRRLQHARDARPAVGRDRSQGRAQLALDPPDAGQSCRSPRRARRDAAGTGAARPRGQSCGRTSSASTG